MTESSAQYFCIVSSVHEILDVLRHDVWNNNPYIIGGGSNILFTQDYQGLIVVNQLKGKEIINETDEYIDIKFSSGESWHECVLWSVGHGYWGIENLVLIPGTIGASSVQNIGAYGASAADTIYSVEVINIKTLEIETLFNQDCNFGYRDSIFKQYPERYIVTAVIYRLSQRPEPKLSYGSIQQELVKNGIQNPTLRQIADTIMVIRRSKLPDVGSIGMAGSFFKNPIINRELFNIIIKKYPNMPSYEFDNDMRKIPAGWVIETLGYKGFREGDVGTYDKHALVLVNYDDARGSDVWNFAQKIMRESKEKFTINLEPEVIIL